MNGQNENQPVRPDFSGSTPNGLTPPAGGPVSPTSGQFQAGGPAPLNAGGVGFNQPVTTSWSPNAVPTPGPMGATPPPPAAPAPTSVPMSSIPGANVNPAAPVAPVAPMPAAPAPVMPAPMAAAPRPVVPPPPPVGGSAVPPPPGGTQYEVRTLASDSEALKASGGTEASPKTFTPAPLGGEEFFSPAAAPAAPAKKKGSNKLLPIILIVVLVIGIGVAGWFFAKPLLMSPAPQIPEALPPAIPPAEETPSEEPVVETPAVTHVSFFATPADVTDSLAVETVTMESLKALFPAPETSTLADGAIRELDITSAGAPLKFSEFLPAMLPDILPAGVSSFEEDFTLFVHKDGTNDLPGFIAKVKADTDPETLSAISAALEASPNAGNFYAVSPGAKSAFRDGAVNGDPVRYAPFATAGYAFNYGWFKDASDSQYLVVASSYKGIVAAVTKAGF